MGYTITIKHNIINHIGLILKEMSKVNLPDAPSQVKSYSGRVTELNQELTLACLTLAIKITLSLSGIKKEVMKCAAKA